MNDANSTLIEFRTGDIAGYIESRRAMREWLENLSGKILIAHHGDCDGIVGGGLAGRYLSDRGLTIKYASSAEFREKDFHYYREHLK